MLLDIKKIFGTYDEPVTAALELDLSEEDFPGYTVPGTVEARITATLQGRMLEIALDITADVAFAGYKVCVVPANSSTQDAGTVIPTTAGSSNTSGSAGNYPAATNIQVTITGTDLETASPGDGAKIVKVFVKNEAGTWSVA